jgi:hypothetical protein|tara:strand:- start:271 stop:1023 length:753 start_codon:yes stop_codon:yes gene_type:complete
MTSSTRRDLSAFNPRVRRLREFARANRRLGETCPVARVASLRQSPILTARPNLSPRFAIIAIAFAPVFDVRFDPAPSPRRVPARPGASRRPHGLVPLVNDRAVLARARAGDRPRARATRAIDAFETQLSISRLFARVRAVRARRRAGARPPPRAAGERGASASRDPRRRRVARSRRRASRVSPPDARARSTNISRAHSRRARRARVVADARASTFSRECHARATRFRHIVRRVSPRARPRVSARARARSM